MDSAPLEPMLFVRQRSVQPRDLTDRCVEPVFGLRLSCLATRADPATVARARLATRAIATGGRAALQLVR
jgi:hypothetical protein